MSSTDWLSAIAILAGGVILGLLFVYFVRRKPAVPAAAEAEELEKEDLEAKRDALVRQLREEGLDAEERTRLELETAQVLRQLDAFKKQRRKGAVAPSTQKPAVVVAQPAGKRAALVGFAWGVGSVALLGGLGYFVMQSAKSRDANQGVTGGETATSTIRPATPPGDPAVQQLEAAVQKSPDDLNVRVELAKAYLERDNLMGVFDQTQYVLAKSPNDSRALTYQALVRLAMGQNADAKSMLDKATQSDPKFIDAWVALAWVNTSMGNTKDAQAAIAAAGKQHPEEKERLAQVYEKMKQQVAAEGGPKPAKDLPPGHPSLPAPGEAPAGAAPAAAASTPQASEPGAIHITLDLAPSAKGKNGVIFVIARPVGVTAGPPVAAKRFAAGSFPMVFDLSAADSMMGQPLPPHVRIEARLDFDGDVTTHDPSEPKAIVESAGAGANLKMVLK